MHSGLRWAAMRQIVTGLVGTLGAVVYTRFLQPEDLGAYALAALVYSGLFLLVQAPFRDAVVYFQDREQDHTRATFWLLAGFSGLAVIYPIHAWMTHYGLSQWLMPVQTHKISWWIVLIMVFASLAVLLTAFQITMAATSY